MKTFREIFNESKPEYASIKELISVKKLQDLLKNYKQSASNFSIKRKSNETNIIDIKLSDEIYLSKDADDRIKIYIVPETLGTHNYLKHVLEPELEKEMDDLFTCRPGDGFKREYIGTRLKKSSSLLKFTDELLDSLSYEGFKYKDGKLENALSDYIKLI